jgi:hemolysin activation/secretion protein
MFETDLKTIMKTTKLLTVLALAGATIFLSSLPLSANDKDKNKENKKAKQEKQQPEARKQDNKSPKEPKEKSQEPRYPQEFERRKSMEPSVLS